MKTWALENGWPCGLSNGLSLECASCGEETNYDYEVLNELWNSVVPEKWRRGVICLDCLDKMTKEHDFFLSNHLIQVQYTGIGETIILKPEEGFVYDHPKL